MASEKEITIYDIAKKLKVSAATVSRGLQDHPAISKKTKKKIFDTVEEMGYRTNHFARNLRSRKTNTIGLIVPRLNSSFMSSVIAGIEVIAHEHGYNLLISQSSESAEKEAASATTLFNTRIDGLLVSLSYNTEDLTHFENFFKKNTPVIFFDRVMEHKACTAVVIDNRKAGYEATSHLISQGCSRIVHITAPQQRNVYIDRLEGYKQALIEHAIPFHEENVIIGNLSTEAGIAAAEEIAKRSPVPDGVFVANDNCAVSCLLTLKQKGFRIPEDIAIVGFNNDPVCNVVEPNLSSIDYSGAAIGQAAARQLINHLNGTSPLNNTGTIILRSELVVRKSSLKSG